MNSDLHDCLEAHSSLMQTTFFPEMRINVLMGCLLLTENECLFFFFLGPAVRRSMFGLFCICIEVSAKNLFL